MKSSALVLRDVTKHFGAVTAVDRLELEVTPGEMMVLVGPSGAGKSTLLRLVAGLERPSSGSIEIDGRDVASLAPGARDVAMVFQDYALYPHMTAYKNIAYGLKVRGVAKAEIRERVGRLAKLLGIEAELQRLPGTLSGGQRQRVAMGRAIIRDPAVFLMDEPLSNLDARLRVHMRAELRELQQRLGVTTLFVTHDQTEAMTMGDRVAVMQGGRVAQLGTPRQLYEQPINVFVAGFLGSPAMNFLLADVGTEGAQFGSCRFPTPRGLSNPRVILGLRPERIVLQGNSDDPGVDGHVVAVEDLGSERLVHVRVPGTAPALPEFDESAYGSPTGGDGFVRLVVRMDSSTPSDVGQDVRIRALPEGAHLFDIESRTSLSRVQGGAAD